jgi:hypothetical protein
MGFRKGTEFPDRLSDYQLLEKDVSSLMDCGEEIELPIGAVMLDQVSQFLI